MFFPAIVTWYPYSSKDAHHNITWGTSGSLSCKYRKIRERIKDQNGDEILASVWLMFPAGTSINDDDKITLPDGTTGKIVKNNVIQDHMNRAVCVEVFLGDS